MSDAVFGTLRLAKGFNDSGVPAEQAEGMARAIALEWQDRMEALATKADLDRLEARMATKEDLAVLEARMATKDQVAALSGRVDLTATKDEAAALAGRITAIEATMATREGLARMQLSLLLALISAVGLSTAILGVLIKI